MVVVLSGHRLRQYFGRASLRSNQTNNNEAYMKKLYRIYMHVLASNHDSVGIWPPGTHVALGDYGEFRKGTWEKKGSIWDGHVDKGMQIPEISRTGNFCLRAKSEDAGKLRFGGLTGKESDEYKLLLLATDCTTYRLTRMSDIGEAILSSSKWNNSWSFVDTVCVARSSLLIVTVGDAESVEVEAINKDFLEELGLEINRVSGNICLSTDERIVHHGHDEPVYMYLSKIANGFLRNPTIERYHLEKPSPPQPLVQSVDLEEILNSIKNENEKTLSFV